MSNPFVFPSKKNTLGPTWHLATKSPFTKFGAYSLLAVMISACGGTGQDSNSPQTTSQTFSGLAIDGNLARATVFVDSNNNGTRDPWETFAFTDNEGYFSYNPNTDTNYCTSTASAQESQYCLRTVTRLDNLVIRVDGGYDILTGEPFMGQMSRRLTTEEQESNDISVISPVTSLLSNIESTTEQASLLSSLGLEQQHLNVNYLNTDGAGNIDSNLLNTALKIHKTVAILSDRLTDTYSQIGEEFDTPNDASSSVYPNLAQELLKTSRSLDQVLADTNTLASVLDSAEADLRRIYENKDIVLPQDLGSVENPSSFSRVIDISSNIPDVINRLIDPVDTNLTNNQAIGTTRALETLVIKTVNETSTNNTAREDSSIENLIRFFDTDTNSENSDLVTTLINTLSQPTADLTSLANNDFSGSDFDTEEEVRASAALDEGAAPFAMIGNQTLRVSKLDLGYGPNNLDDSEVEFYFTGMSTDTDGAFDACVKFIEDASEDGTLDDGSTRGELVTGFWSLLGAEGQNAESYSLLITITFLGTTYQAILKPNGSVTIDDTEYSVIRFDFDGEVENWHSVNGFTTTEVTPTSNSDCETRLPSRIGI